MSEPLEIAEILTIAMGRETFALPASMVLEILDPGPATPVPTAPAFVNHLINFRGRVVPLADLRLRCGMQATVITSDTRVVVLEIQFEGQPILVAILADKVYDVSTLERVVADQVPRIGTRWNPEFVKAIGRRNDEFVMILDIDRIFATSDPVM
ncbi:MAG: chemotaxis protein CheW [Magnetococcales bacterium]|nr:chemotaxis protein CheW [Magnetococcales bacterium]NGZ27456.1 chemotaxis protein CheW [Magnetococcales bacterium]